MNKVLGIFASFALSLGFIEPVNALTTHLPSDWVANGNKGSVQILDDNITNLKGELNHGPYSKASNAMLKDGIVEETYVDLNFNDIKDNEFFEVTLGLKNNKDEYVTEAVVMTQRIGDKIKVTAGWAPDFEAEITQAGIYTYRWNMYVKEGNAFVQFSLLNNNQLVASTQEVSLDSEQAKGPDTKSPVAQEPEVSVKYLWFCNIQVANGINVYSVLPGNAEVSVVDTTNNGLTLDNIDKINQVIKDTLANLHFAEANEDTLYKVEFDSQDIEVSQNIINEFTNVINNVASNAVIAKYFDISLVVKDAMTNKKLGEIEKLTEGIDLTINIPSNLPSTNNNFGREFYILKEHDGAVEIIPAVINSDGTKVTFNTDQFSTYALAYRDVTVEVPNTLDNIMFYVSIGIASLIGIISLGYFLYQKNKKNKKRV